MDTMGEYDDDEKQPPMMIHAAFHAQALKTPNAVCLIDSTTGASLTYAQVQTAVLTLATELHEQHGAGLEKVVAIYMPVHMVEYIIAMLAVLTAGAAYVPLELAYPVSMLQNVLQDSQPVAVLTTVAQKACLPQTTPNSTTFTVLCVDDNSRQHATDTSTTTISSTVSLLQELLEKAQSWPQPDYSSLAFVVYSSGTTGQPKGIANPHAAPALSYAWRYDTFQNESAVVACNVFFVWECLRPLMHGAAVLPVPTDVVLDGEELTVLLQKHQVNEMLFTPSLLENVLSTVPRNVLQERLGSTLQTVFLNGEVVSMQLRSRCLELLPDTDFINLYSISECHEVGAVNLRDIDTTGESAAKFCPIGVPSCPIFILDDDHQPVANGEAGELYVAGDMLARGYLNLPELTASRFVPNPFCNSSNENNGAIMYRTGDRARVLPNGQLEILGRCDFMVKIRGYSIVLGAVEAALMQAVALTSCVVVADGDEGEDKHLVAYLVRDTVETNKEDRLTAWSVDGRTGACPEIRHAVDGLLPHYMVPAVFIEVETLPVCAVGAKLDRKALQAQASADRRTMLRSLQFSTETHTTHHHHLQAVASADELMDGDEVFDVSLARLVKYLRVPRTAPIQDIQVAMILVWEQVLDKSPVSIANDFHQLGGHSLSAARLAAIVNKVFGVKISATRLFRDNTTVRDLCHAVIAAAASADDGHSNSSISNSTDKDWSVVEATSASPPSVEDEKILQQVRNDSILPPDLVIAPSTAADGGGSVISLMDARSIFLTGATGFLGAHLLAELLNRNSSATILCLVRSKDPLAVKSNLEKYGLKADPSRIVLVQGDLSLPLFGFDQAEWNRVASAVDAVVHCGAAVSLTAAYSVLRPANVNGTLSAIRLAAACRPGSSLVHVSSNGIFPADKGAVEIFLENDDVACLPDRLGALDGYGLSKWAAERLISGAHTLGLPTLTIRFGNIGWHSTTGVGNSLDYQGMLLNGCLRLAQRPDVDGWQFEVTPVDFAASTLVALAGDKQLLTDGSIFNCVQDGFTASNQVFEWMGQSRVTIPAVSMSGWKQSVEDFAANSTDNELTALFAFVSGLQDSYLSERAYLDCSKLDATLSSIDPSLSRKNLVGKQYYRRYFDKANVSPSMVLPTDSGVIAVPVDKGASLESPTGPLTGQVAVVTGASSGIGRAIVQALVESGCHVAMGARRMSELEKTRDLVSKSCPGSASKTVLVSTDVTKQEDVASLVEQAERSLGPVDILVNCAGVMYFTLMKNVIWDQWERTVDVNCKGPMYGIGTVLPKMLARGKGHIVNITSDAGRKAFPGLGVYSGSKFFVEAMSQALRAETAATGLRVTCIQPGNVQTPLLSTSTDPEGLKEYGEPTGAKVLEPADIGRAVVYAVSQPEWCAVNEILVEPREEPA